MVTTDRGGQTGQGAERNSGRNNAVLQRQLCGPVSNCGKHVIFYVPHTDLQVYRNIQQYVAVLNLVLSVLTTSSKSGITKTLIYSQLKQMRLGRENTVHITNTIHFKNSFSGLVCITSFLIIIFIHINSFIFLFVFSELFGGYFQNLLFQLKH